MTKTAIIYARVSSARQADEGLPVESQIEQCYAKAEALGATVAHVFRDEGISGRTMNRPGMRAALNYCDLGRVHYLITWSTSRFARNFLDAANLKQAFAGMGVKIAYVSNEFGEGDDAWMAESITNIVDERYSRQIAKDTRRSMAKNARDGNWNGGHVPFGFRPVEIGKRKRLEPHPDEAPIVRQMFQWCLAGSGAKDIASRLNTSGAYKRGQKWNKNAVYSVLKNRVVLGEISYHDENNAITTAAHSGLIPEEDFMKVTQLLDQRKPENVGGQTRSTAVFVGMLRCGRCGEAMMTETAKGRSQRYHYYNCRSHLKGVGCKGQRIPVKALDDWLLEGIVEKIFTVDNLRSIARELKEIGSNWQRDQEARLDTARRDLTSVEKKLRRMYETIEEDAGLNLHDVAPRLRELRDRQDALRKEIERLDNEPAPPTEISDREVERLAEGFQDMMLDCEDPKRIRSFLSNIIERVVMNDGIAEVIYRPNRIAAAQEGGSYCDGRWLPELSTLRTITLVKALKRRA